MKCIVDGSVDDCSSTQFQGQTTLKSHIIHLSFEYNHEIYLFGGYTKYAFISPFEKGQKRIHFSIYSYIQIKPDNQLLDCMFLSLLDHETASFSIHSFFCPLLYLLYYWLPRSTICILIIIVYFSASVLTLEFFLLLFHYSAWKLFTPIPIISVSISITFPPIDGSMFKQKYSFHHSSHLQTSIPLLLNYSMNICNHILYIYGGRDNREYLFFSYSFLARTIYNTIYTMDLNCLFEKEDSKKRLHLSPNKDIGIKINKEKNASLMTPTKTRSKSLYTPRSANYSSTWPQTPTHYHNSYMFRLSNDSNRSNPSYSTPV